MLFLNCNLKLYKSNNFFSYLLFLGVFYLALLFKHKKVTLTFSDFLKKKFFFFKFTLFLFFSFLSLIFINRQSSIKKQVKIVDYCDFPLQNANRYI